MNTKKLLALLLALVMILCAMPVVYAAVDDPAVKDDSDVSIDIEELPATGEEEVLYGDVNDDGKVTLVDVMKTLQYYKNPTTQINAAANVNGDGDINLVDVMKILQHYKNPSIVLGPQA